MAYETTYSSMLADQENLINMFLEQEDQRSEAPVYDVDEETEKDVEEDYGTPEDYKMYKEYYEEHEAKNSLSEFEEDDAGFLDFLFSGDNKYKSFSMNRPSDVSYGSTGASSEGLSEYNNYVNQFRGGTNDLKSSIAYTESRGNYKAVSPNSSARGKYQFIWSIHKDKIAQQTGVRSQEEFLNNPQAQEDYFNYWDQTTLSPSADANLAKFKQYYPNATRDDVKKATHFAGRGGLEKALKTGNFTEGIDANKMSIERYVFKN